MLYNEAHKAYINAQKTENPDSVKDKVIWVISTLFIVILSVLGAVL